MNDVQVNYENVHHFLTVALDNLPLSVGLTLKASNELNSIDDVGMVNLPFITLTCGTIDKTDWHAFESKNILQVVGSLKVPQDGNLDRYQVLRSIIDDIDLQLAKVRGLPLLDGELHIYQDDITPELIANNKLAYLCNQGGPRITKVNVSNHPDQPFAQADIIIELDYVTDFNPDQPLPRARYVDFVLSQRLNGVNVANKELSIDSLVEPPGNTIIGLQILPYDTDLTVNETVNLAVAKIQLDGSRFDITSAATYGSSDPTIASVDNAGKITALKAGSVNITATFNGISQSVSVLVS